MKHLKQSQKKTPMAPWQEAMAQFHRKLSRLDRKRKFWKFYLYAFIVLPIFILVLALKALKTYVRIKLQEIARNHPMDPES